MKGLLTSIHRLLLLSALATASAFAADPFAISGDPAQAGFQLAAGRRAADLCIDPADAKVVKIAADCLSEDVSRVTGVKPRVKGDTQGLSGQAVFIGTVGKSAMIDGLIRNGKLDASAIQGKWESFVVATVANPLPGVKNGLVIAGSDRRGTAYGVFSLSEAIGVSPWVWWADVAPGRSDALIVKSSAFTSKPPSVKYRGIFINDEDWGLQPWAAKTFEPETRDIGPKTYAKVFELLLRLKANYLWPAMHESTCAFNAIPLNKVVADEYAIVMGSSHAEPMLLNSATEWKFPKEQYNYETHPDVVKGAWKKRLQENGKYENTYTVGIRGIHDRAMQGGKTEAEKRGLLETVFADQRNLIGRYVDPKVEQVPQIFVPYKEVLPIYKSGLKVPEDVTLVWVDDNHGYIRQLSTPAEQKRRGGAGVYYHLSYWGAPEDYLWLNTIPPALIWEEMSKAYDHGARNVWVVNVGDIKPQEIGMEFFLRMAWDITPWDESAQPTYLKQWADREFGKQYGAEAAAIMDEYYRLNYPVKPEHLLKAQFTNAYNEIAERLQRFEKLVDRTNVLHAKLPSGKKDAFYQLVAYPVRGSALMNEKFLNPSPQLRNKAYEQIQAETKYYNEELMGGKWCYMMSSHPRDLPVFSKPGNDTKLPATPGPVAPSASKDSTVSIEAEHPTRRTESDGAKWKVISGLGRTGDSIALLPTTASISAAAALEYQFTAAKAGPAKVFVHCIPTFAVNRDAQLRYSISIGNETPKIVTIAAKEFSGEWSKNVLRATAIGTSEHTFSKPGGHTLRLRALDPGVVFDKIVIDQGDLKPSFMGPPET